MPLSTSEWLSLAAAALFLIIAFSIFSAPFRWLLKLLLNAGIGLIGLIGINLLGLPVAVNAITVAITAILGLPGLALILLIKLVLL